MRNGEPHFAQNDAEAGCSSPQLGQRADRGSPQELQNFAVDSTADPHAPHTISIEVEFKPFGRRGPDADRAPNPRGRADRTCFCPSAAGAIPAVMARCPDERGSLRRSGGHPRHLGARAGPVWLLPGDPRRRHPVRGRVGIRGPCRAGAEHPGDPVRAGVGDQDVHRRRRRDACPRRPDSLRNPRCRHSAGTPPPEHARRDPVGSSPALSHLRDRRLRRGRRELPGLRRGLRSALVRTAQLPHRTSGRLPAPVRRPAGPPATGPGVSVLERRLHPARPRHRADHRHVVPRGGAGARLRAGWDDGERLLPARRGGAGRGDRIRTHHRLRTSRGGRISTASRSSGARTAGR